MSTNYEAFAAFASNLLSSNAEIDWRMSAARSYYACYHRALLSAKYCPDNSHLAMGSHEKLADRFIQQGAMNARSIAYVLQTMKKMRHIADYTLNTDFHRSDAVNQVEQCKKLVSRLDEFDAQIAPKTA